MRDNAPYFAPHMTNLHHLKAIPKRKQGQSQTRDNDNGVVGLFIGGILGEWLFTMGPGSHTRARVPREGGAHARTHARTRTRGRARLGTHALPFLPYQSQVILSQPRDTCTSEYTVHYLGQLPGREGRVEHTLQPIPNLPPTSTTYPPSARVEITITTRPGKVPNLPQGFPLPPSKNSFTR